MLYVLTGSDVMKAKARASALTEGFEVVRFGEGAEAFSRAVSYVGASGLFAPKAALLLDRPSEHAEGEDLLETHGADFQNATMPIVLIEPELSAAAQKKLPKGSIVERYDISYQDTDAPAPSVFALSDAFAAGDRKKSWILFRRFIESGFAPEELHGTLAWQARAMVLASKTTSAVEAGLKPFVYSKTKRAVSKMTPEQTESISRELVRILHASRMGQGRLEDLLEAFLLRKA